MLRSHIPSDVGARGVRRRGSVGDEFAFNNPVDDTLEAAVRHREARSNRTAPTRLHTLLQHSTQLPRNSSERVRESDDGTEPGHVSSGAFVSSRKLLKRPSVTEILRPVSIRSRDGRSTDEGAGDAG